jgi:hypothetical protein
MMMAMKLKLQQGQVWKAGPDFLRLVEVERLSVKYKAIKKFAGGEGTHHEVTKKEFCRLIKGASLLTPEEIKAEQFNSEVDHNLERREDSSR